MINGILNIYKEAGYTSHDVVAKLRGILRQKKIGHTGTLDPQAVGVLPVCLGSATRLCDMLTDEGKEYVTVMRLGITTDTQDMTGAILEQRPVTSSEQEVREAALAFIGEYEQVPPMYSALKVNGKRLYELARQGKEVERKPRNVFLSEVDILEISLPMVKMRVSCSKGTYIRTLCHDIGLRLGCGACMETLERTRVGRFSAQESLTLQEVENLRDSGLLACRILPVDSVFETFPRVDVLPAYRKWIDNGNALSAGQIIKRPDAVLHEGQQCRVYNDSGQFCGLYRWLGERGGLKPVKMFPVN